MFTFLLRLLPAGAVVRRAHRLRSAGNAQAALAAALIGLDKLKRRGGGGEMETACALTGALLLEVGRGNDAVELLVQGRAHLADEPAARTFLVGTLLSARST